MTIPRLKDDLEMAYEATYAAFVKYVMQSGANKEEAFAKVRELVLEAVRWIDMVDHGQP